MKRALDFFRLLLPLGRARRQALKRIEPHLSREERSDIKYLLKLGQAGIHYDGYETRLHERSQWPQLSLATEDATVAKLLEKVNARIRDAEQLILYRAFARRALEQVTTTIAPNIIGLDEAKRGAALQLFSSEPVHILLLGDPGTGKTEILRAIERLAPHAVFGLGSGASKAGLVGSYEGHEFRPGILVQADEGAALVDELNLMRKEDLAGLYSAMEKGFVSYDKKGKHERFDARVRVLATANPKGDSFIGKDRRFLRSQLPFEQALLSRFHLIYLIRKPTGKELEQITRRIVRNEQASIAEGDADFIRDYVEYARKLNVTFDEKYESMIVDFIEELKRTEEQYLVEVGPRLVVGIIRLAKAAARARLSRKVSANDVELALRTLRESLDFLVLKHA